jgi:hypothetical protein
MPHVFPVRHNSAASSAIGTQAEAIECCPSTEQQAIERAIAFDDVD